MKDLFEDEIGETVTPDDKLNLYIKCHTERDKKSTFLYAIFRGQSFVGACGVAELSVKEVKKWLAEGESPESEHYKFYVKYNKMLGLCEYNKLTIMNEAERNGAWNAAAWHLERTRPERYSNKQEVKVDSENLQIVLDVPHK